MFVVLFELAALAHVGNDTLEPVVQVMLPLVVPVAVVPALFFIVPVPPFLLNVIVFVFTLQTPPSVLLYPAEHVAYAYIVAVLLLVQPVFGNV